MSKRYGTPFTLYEGDHVVGGNPALGETGASRFLGLSMGQNQHALFAFDTLFKVLEQEDARPARVIELGTGRGGLSAFLHLYSLAAGVLFTTWDQPGYSPEHHSVLEALGVAFRQGDILGDVGVVEEIKDECRSAGLTVLLCDNGHKAREVAIYASSLKPGDILLAHDYAPDGEYFARHMQGRLWPSHELSFADIAAPVESYSFEPYLDQLFQRAAWVCMRRRPEAGIGERLLGHPQNTNEMANEMPAEADEAGDEATSRVGIEQGGPELQTLQPTR